MIDITFNMKVFLVMEIFGTFFNNRMIYFIVNICPFILTRKGLPASAICAFHLTDIEKALDGPFKEQSTPNSYWTEATGVPSLRPGQVFRIK